jgi:hypothetical protein
VHHLPQIEGRGVRWEVQTLRTGRLLPLQTEQVEVEIRSMGMLIRGLRNRPTESVSVEPGIFTEGTHCVAWSEIEPIFDKLL